jgi:hypothetical protein
MEPNYDHLFEADFNQFMNMDMMYPVVGDDAILYGGNDPMLYGYVGNDTMLYGGINGEGMVTAGGFQGKFRAPLAPISASVGVIRT